MNRTKTIYETPLVRVAAVSTEHGFATSGGFGEANQAGASVSEDPNYTYDL